MNNDYFFMIQQIYKNLLLKVWKKYHKQEIEVLINLEEDIMQSEQYYFLNETKLQVSTINNLDQAFLATGFPYNIDQNPMLSIEIFSSFLKRGSPIRRLGSAALDLAYVAAGRFDSYWETGINSWDVAAGILLVEEAGGLVSKWDGEKYSVLKRSEILASNALLHPSMIESLKKGRGL